MDAELRYKDHVANAATMGLEAAMCLRRLKMLPPQTARQLFMATVAPTMDYASMVWAHTCGKKQQRWLSRAHCRRRFGLRWRRKDYTHFVG